MAERDKKGSSDADQYQHQQQQPPTPPLPHTQLQRQQQDQQQQQGAPSDAVTQQAAQLMLAMLQQMQRQISATSGNGVASTTTAEIERNAAFAGAAYRVITHGLSLEPASKVESLTPRDGARSGGTAVKIAGTNFLPDATVLFGTVPARNVSVISTTEIHATVPPAQSPGIVEVVVVSSVGRGARLAEGFNYT